MIGGERMRRERERERWQLGRHTSEWWREETGAFNRPVCLLLINFPRFGFFFFLSFWALTVIGKCDD